jgi:hypothetical protein
MIKFLFLLTLSSFAFAGADEFVLNWNSWKTGFILVSSFAILRIPIKMMFDMIKYG